MTAEAKALAEQWKLERKYRDCGVASKKTWKKLRRLITAEEQIELLAEVG